MKIWVVTSLRSDFGLVRPVLKWVVEHTAQDIELVCLGRACRLEDAFLQAGIGPFPIHRIGFDAVAEHIQTPGEQVRAMAVLAQGVSDLLSSAAPPDWCLCPGDRFEMFAAVTAAYYSNVPVAHLFAGDRSVGGSLDDNVRHAITKLAHAQLAVSSDSYQRLLLLGEEPWRVFMVGSPVVESIREILATPSLRLSHLMTPRRFNVVCTYHPITTESEDAGRQCQVLVDALALAQQRLDLACLFTPPNNEPGSAAIAAILSRAAQRAGFTVVGDLGWNGYLETMSQCDAVVGNSSSGLLEAPILGVPTLDVGTRQKGRLAPPSVKRAEAYDAAVIADALVELLVNKCDTLPHPYGDGHASERIEHALTRLLETRTRREILQKAITY